MDLSPFRAFLAYRDRGYRARISHAVPLVTAMRADMGMRGAAWAKPDAPLVIVRVFGEGAFLEIRTRVESPALVAEVIVRYFLGHLRTR